MNPRWLIVGAMAAASLAGCATNSDGTASSVSFAANASAVSGAVAPPAQPAVAEAGASCGTVSKGTGTVEVVVEQGMVNCAEALRTGTVYAAAAAQAGHDALYVETAGWGCTSSNETRGICQFNGNSFRVG